MIESAKVPVRPVRSDSRRVLLAVCAGRFVSLNTRSQCPRFLLSERLAGLIKGRQKKKERRKKKEKKRREERERRAGGEAAAAITITITTMRLTTLKRKEEAHEDEIWAVAWNPRKNEAGLGENDDGKKELLTGSVDESCKVWR